MLEDCPKEAEEMNTTHSEWVAPKESGLPQPPVRVTVYLEGKSDCHCSGCGDTAAFNGRDVVPLAWEWAERHRCSPTRIMFGKPVVSVWDKSE